ncbi:hypothetical protein, partial [Akkermansia sp.]|uniref:hypothetical protein n=1 Tax=Akkermansia sp. TaxID=1872421 RepID=UPI003AB5E887
RIYEIRLQENINTPKATPESKKLSHDKLSDEIEDRYGVHIDKKTLINYEKLAWHLHQGRQEHEFTCMTLQVIGRSNLNGIHLKQSNITIWLKY